MNDSTITPKGSLQAAGSAWCRKRQIGFLFWVLTGGSGIGLSFACFVDYGNGWVPLLIAIPMTLIGMFNSWPARIQDRRSLLFSQRRQIAIEAEQWCKNHDCPANPINIVNAMEDLNLIK